jgi:methyltransferase-like protein/2-polyprenyl-3-methyl-5-hydroxy-6-metoxy-1,4-benzoquinol methylase
MVCPRGGACEIRRMTSPTSYDEIAYPGFPYPQTHPSTLATLGHLYGLDVVPVDHCRVLELGCGDGQNLIPMAVQLPESQFVGIDLAESAIASGQSYARELGLRNIELGHEDVLRFECAPGSFDYIIAHGLYSWVPPEVQKRILQLIRQGLSTGGVAYVSYNALPGGHFRLMAREMMQFHTRATPSSRAKVEHGKALMQFLAQASPKSKAYGDAVRELWEEELSMRREEVLAHDELCECNENLYFHEFMSRAHDHGLKFLAEAVFMEMFPPDLEPQVARFLDQFEDDVLAREQYLDFVKGRRFRQTLLCHAEAPIARQISLARVLQLHFAGSARPLGPLFEPQVVSPVEFEGTNGATVAVGHPLVKAALHCLCECWPRSFSLDALRIEALRKLEQSGVSSSKFDTDDDHLHLLQTLLLVLRGGLIEVGTQARGLVSRPSDRPTASPLARLQARSNHSHATSLLHARWQIPGALERELLALLDGSRDRACILAALVEAAQSGRLAVTDLGAEVGDEGRVRANLKARIESLLEMFARVGLLSD